MKISIKRLWAEPKVVGTILENSTKQDPFILLSNPRVRILRNNGNPAAYLIMLHRKRYSVLKNIFTYPKYRKRGIARQLIQEGLRHYDPPCFLICRPRLQVFYEKLGFKLVRKAPAEIRFHLAFGTVRSAIFGGPKAIAMVYNPPEIRYTP